MHTMHHHVLPRGDRLQIRSRSTIDAGFGLEIGDEIEVVHKGLAQVRHRCKGLTGSSPAASVLARKGYRTSLWLDPFDLSKRRREVDMRSVSF